MNANKVKNPNKYNTLVFHRPKNGFPYVSLNTPEGEFRINTEGGEGYHGLFVSFIKKGQTVEQDICMAELNPDNLKEFAVRVWTNPNSEEYQEDFRFGQYFEPRCPYCGSYDVKEVDNFREEAKFLCEDCEEDFLMDNTGKYTTRNRFPLTPIWEMKKKKNKKEKEQG